MLPRTAWCARFGDHRIAHRVDCVVEHVERLRRSAEERASMIRRRESPKRDNRCSVFGSLRPSTTLRAAIDSAGCASQAALTGMSGASVRNSSIRVVEPQLVQPALEQIAEQRAERLPLTHAVEQRGREPHAPRRQIDREQILRIARARA